MDLGERMSALLFHGPGAREDALLCAEQTGRLLAEPLGDNGLTAEEVRAAVRLLNSAVIGSRIGVVLLGPVDAMRSAKAPDVLLKTLEDHDPKAVQPILWAWDAGDVRGTVRSRCLQVWCPFGPDPVSPYRNDAMEICRSALKREWGGIIEIMKEHEREEADLVNRDRALQSGVRRRQILTACAAILSEANGTAWLPLWLSIRAALHHRQLSKNEALVALLVGPGR